MKRFLLLLGTLFCAFNLSAQNYDSYLQSAYTALEEGKIEVAQSSYNIYKKMTGRTDVDFETLLKDKSENDWKKSCYIIDLGDGYCLAAQKVDKSKRFDLVVDDAEQRCKSDRLGGFSDWRLPGKDELSVILANQVYPDGLYWSTNDTGFGIYRIAVPDRVIYGTDSQGDDVPIIRKTYFLQSPQGEIIKVDYHYWVEDAKTRKKILYNNNVFLGDKKGAYIIVRHYKK